MLFFRRYVFLLLFLVISALLSLFIATHIGLLELPDGFFYFALGDFILYGRLYAINPFNNHLPQTLYGPVYSIFLAFIIRTFPQVAISIIPFIQLFLVSISGLLVFFTTTLLLGKKWRFLSVIIFFNLPFLLIYATSFMSETITLFILTLYSYILVLLLKKKIRLPPSTLVFLGSLLTLTKNAYLPVFVLSVLLWIFLLWRDQKKMTVVHGYLLQIPAILGIIGILLWIRFNNTHHNIYALTNYTGRHLYNNVVNAGRLLPDPSEPIYQEFLQRLGYPEAFFIPEYEVQRYFINEFHSKKITETQIDKKFLALSIAAIKRHPLAYVVHIGKVSWNIIISPPYHGNLLTTLGAYDPTCPDCQPSECRIRWDMNLCKQRVYDPVALNVWAIVLNIQRNYYPWITSGIALIACIGIIYACIKKEFEILILAGIFLVSILIHGAAQAPDGRYLIPVYSLYTICIINGIKAIKALYCLLSPNTTASSVPKTT